jgi:hypothetical protein
MGLIKKKLELLHVNLKKDMKTVAHTHTHRREENKGIF